MFHAPLPESQCTFWRSVLSDKKEVQELTGVELYVSMHLLALSAFRHQKFAVDPILIIGVSMHLLVPSAFRLQICIPCTTVV